jgi:hypothetical protein
MEFGLFHLLMHRDNPRGISGVVADNAALVELAEAVGFGTAWFAEHHFTNYSLSVSPMMMAANLAGRTSRIRLGPCVVVLALHNPLRIAQEVALLAALGEVTFELFKRLGLNVELATSDWGSLMKRRASQDPVEKGGWSLYHTSWASLAIASPATNSTIRGLGKAGWAGWYESAPMEAAFQQWLAAPDAAGRAAAARLMQEIALRDAPSIPLGQIFPRTAFRKDITGIMEAPAPLPWPVRRA